jgi:CDP-diacylglycerol--serine O-phosphatidyltransferase
MRFNLPNTLTCLNLFCGCIAAVMIFRNHLEYGAYFVLLAAFFDLLDGMAARKLSLDPAFGKELDSLADVVSFGFVPGAMMFKLFQLSQPENFLGSESLIRVIQFFPFVITVFSALRLAKFNLDTRQHTRFIGMPTPANALMIISFPLMLHQSPAQWGTLVLNPWFILSFSLISSFLLVAELPLFSLKFQTFGIKQNIFPYLLILSALLLFPFFLFAAIPMIIFLYILLSVVQNYFTSTR